MMNAQQCCSTLNFWVVPKVASQAFLSILLLCTGTHACAIFRTYK